MDTSLSLKGIMRRYRTRAELSCFAVHGTLRSLDCSHVCAVCLLSLSCVLVQMLWVLGPFDEDIDEYEDSAMTEIRCAAEFKQEESQR